MIYQITNQWTALSVITGVAIGSPVVMRNAGRPGDLVEMIVSSSQPSVSDRGDPLPQLLNSWRVSGQTDEIWVRYIKYDGIRTVLPEGARTCLLSVNSPSYILEDSAIPEDLVDSNPYGLRRLKTASQNSSASATIEEKRFSIASSYTIDNNTKLALNIAPASDILITRVSTNDGLKIEFYDQYATGQVDGVFASVNMNMCSMDSSPTNAQLYYNATAAGSKLTQGKGSIEPFIVTCEDYEPCVIITNDTGSSTEVDITIEYEEIGPRNPSFGLMATTQLTATTDMTQYG